MIKYNRGFLEMMPALQFSMGAGISFLKIYDSVKICLIHDENEVSTISEGPVNEIQELELHEGQYHISIVGDKAKGEMDFALSANENVSVRSIDK